MKSTDLLMEDHRHIFRALNVLEEIEVRVQRGRSPNEKDVKDVLGFLNDFGDHYHQGSEEFVLFPALLRDRGQKNYRELCGMVFEHNRQRYLIEGIANSMITRKTKDFVYCSSQLVKSLRTHLKEEEDTLFSLMATTLSPFDDERIVRDIKTYDGSWRDAHLPGLLKRLQSLETKYLQKALTG